MRETTARGRLGESAAAVETIEVPSLGLETAAHVHHVSSETDPPDKILAGHVGRVIEATPTAPRS